MECPVAMMNMGTVWIILTSKRIQKSALVFVVLDESIFVDGQVAGISVSF
jgi:hypothetical protein